MALRSSIFYLVFAAILSCCLLASNVHAGVYLTSPDSKTKESGGSSLEIRWRDDHKKPSLKSWGNLTFWLGTGSTDEQFMLQRLASDVRSNAHSVKAKIDKSVGASSEEYFIRVVGDATLKDGTHPETYSARFELDKMTGKWNSTVDAVLKGISSSKSRPKGIIGGVGGGRGGGGSGGSTTTTTTTPTALPSTRPPSATTTAPKSGARMGAEMPLVGGGPVAATLACLVLSIAAGLAVL
ncbi:hypothetical protein CF319_g2239 [Tilletia indica]|uniref:Yeast cell wall synthesis Kre9/Knh1-like N-terminal domain-containing protein n=1 Tax=Tilletia walkeri TaxID=117179 RepID=A0A8X7N813_9BASI|nr:hypothetical protein CF327_g5457 [Tilletia walkeri]KAE8224952.1 hypothetical protein CF319_g2239 [Tilletia indica]KAE8268013.1 hypothetical protein A4X09_0g4323 [Tilletia walkeri]